LMDQSVVSGIGNVYRAEILFSPRIRPPPPCRSAGYRHRPSALERLDTAVEEGSKNRGDDDQG